MKETFDAYFPELLKHEGGYVDHPSDPGGATKYGITFQTLQAWRGQRITKADVKALTKTEAAAIYREKYWNAIGGDDLPAGVDALALDIAVNHGVGRWREWRSIAAGKTASQAIRDVTARRRTFYRRLKTFPTFGKGWMRRADEVEAWAKMRVRASEMPVQKEEPPAAAPVAPEPVLAEPADAKPKNTPISAASRTAQGTVTAGASGLVVAGSAATEMASKLQEANTQISGGTWLLIAAGILTMIGAAYAFYARWRDGGGLFPWERK